jgi:hypothetical protein
VRYVRTYRAARGMSWHHDVHDWLGGYPYESASLDEVTRALEAAGFTLLRNNTRMPLGWGVFGTACDEFVARRGSNAAPSTH